MSVVAANSHILYREVYHREQQQQISSVGSCLLLSKSYGFGIDGRKGSEWKKKGRRDMRVGGGFWPDLSRPTFVEMEPITDCDQLDQILLHAQQQLSQPIIIDWMASWCRKCIYLKPKLEKLAAEFDTKIKFYYVDVNKVSQALVKRGNISKMPTIQGLQRSLVSAQVISKATMNFFNDLNHHASKLTTILEESQVEKFQQLSTFEKMFKVSWPGRCTLYMINTKEKQVQWLGLLGRFRLCPRREKFGKV